ncbi:hypothetical protein QBZ16_000736 [Prototheca wickerhamii]|uniref:Prolyl 4-hydroxylase alpha subunit domain-containing protein n=1 Tax=Prototheca wickerhamii TaxID=3111 RepID=A0AAD9MK39_PROWI|nr:hypothetical protein QBZ16_000736 [Prototheca wickerhamii]
MVAPSSRRGRPGGRPGGTKDRSFASALAWLDDYDAVCRWMGRYDVEEALDRGGGVAWLPDFLPGHVAKAALRILQALPPGAWNSTQAGDDRGSNDISHTFWSTKSAPGTLLEPLLRVFPVLLPGFEFSTFSAARYDKGHHIAPHDDRAYVAVQCEDGGIIQCSRAIALVYYLTPDWKPGFGGAFVDIQGGGAAHPPRFNTAVAFRIPRWHEVAPVLGPEPRHSVFGWFLTPGRLYELDDAVQGLDDESLAPQRCKLGRRLLGLAGLEDGVEGDVDDGVEGDVADANGAVGAGQGV